MQILNPKDLYKILELKVKLEVSSLRGQQRLSTLLPCIHLLAWLGVISYL